MQAPLYPVSLEVFQATVAFKEFKSGQTLSCGEAVSMRTAPLNIPTAPPATASSMAASRSATSPNTEHYEGRRDETIVELCRGADVMIYDSSYTDAEYPRYRGWGTRPGRKGARIADAAGVGTLAIFHHDPRS